MLFFMAIALLLQLLAPCSITVFQAAILLFFSFFFLRVASLLPVVHLEFLLLEL